jgi:O-glycosyl hydrolase
MITTLNKTPDHYSLLLIIVLLTLLLGCQKEGNDFSATIVNQTWSSESGMYCLANQPDLTTTPVSDNDSILSIHVDPSILYQNFLGFGESFDGSTIYNLARMTSSKRTELLEKLIDPGNGAGFNLFRICIGTSDFSPQSWGWYSLDDMPDGQTDPDLIHFSIQKDINNNSISILKEALQIAEVKGVDVRFIASPWSPPAWMKDNNPASMVGGELQSLYNGAYATYLFKFLEAYKNEGIPIYAITVQNEPGWLTSTPCTFMDANQEAEIIILLKSLIDSDPTLDTKILAFDWNFNDISYPTTVLSDPQARAAVYGVAFHAYDWLDHDEKNIGQLHELFPDKIMFHTERAFWNTDGMDMIVKMFRNWISTYVGWVTLLDNDNTDDSDQEDEQYPGAATPPYFILEASDGDVNIDSYLILPTYYLKQQFSKYIGLEAKRIYSDAGGYQLSNVSFLNPDGTIALVVVNQNDLSLQFRVMVQTHQFVAEIPGKTVATYRWNMETCASSPDVDLAIGKVVKVSSADNTYEAENAVDGDPGTRWASEWTDDEWIYVDLGSAMEIHRVVLDWEEAFGKEYLIQLSDDAITWNTVYHENYGYIGDHAYYLSTRARYVKVQGIRRGTVWGYSLFGFMIY